MKLIVLGSSSSGNCYLLTNGQETLIIECGIKFREVQKTLDFSLSSIVGCIVSHGHGDHFGRVDEYLNYGVQIYCSQGTIDAFKFKGISRPTAIKNTGTFKLGDFKIRAFDIEHDAPEPYGYLIGHPEMGKMLFMTDSYYSQYKFSGLSHILLEANFSDEILQENMESGSVHPSHAGRLLTSHMSLSNAKDLLNANDLSGVVNIVLLHLSSQNSDSTLFRSEIEKVTGKMVYIAEKGLTINLNKEGF
jgi:phosphoribosyl 1,2-cyclic phosphodiesterase